MKTYIELIDGTRIEAFPKSEQPKLITEDKLTINVTSEYFNIKKIDSQVLVEDKKLETKRMELFMHNADRLIANSNKILANSRMFLAPLPIKNGLAYTGVSGFQNPTLGIYLEWWKYNPCAWTEDKLGIKRPIYYIAGSPLSGNNKCGYIGSQGESCSVYIPSFKSVWHSFIEVNTRYNEAKQRYEAYNIEDVINRLFE